MADQPNNGDRAAWAEQAVRVFQSDTGTDDCDAVADLIGDLLHFAASKGMSPLNELRRGVSMFRDETLPDCGWGHAIEPLSSVSIEFVVAPGEWNPEGGVM